MSVQKFIVSKESSNYTVIPNAVLQGIRDMATLALYCYLSSLPTGWEFHKNQLRDHFEIGVKKLDRCLRKLAQYNLVNIAQVRMEDGRFAHFALTVKDGTFFKIKDLQGAHRSAETVPTVTVEPLREAINTINTNTIKNKNNISYASDDAHVSEFENFWNEYPLKKDKQRTKKIWERKKYDKIATLILTDVKKRKATEWLNKDKHYIPHPSTYLNNERWTDEILEPVTQQKNAQTLNKHTEIRSTVPKFKKLDDENKYYTTENRHAGISALKDIMKKLPNHSHKTDRLT